MELLKEDPVVDALIFMQPIALFSRFLGRSGVGMLLKTTLDAQKILEKPLILVVEKMEGFGGEQVVQEAIDRYQAANLAVFPDFRLAARVTRYLADYHSFLERTVR